MIIPELFPKPWNRIVNFRSDFPGTDSDDPGIMSSTIPNHQSPSPCNKGVVSRIFFFKFVTSV